MICPACKQPADFKSLPFGARLRLLRQELKLTAREAASACGISQPGYSYYENLDHFPGEVILNRISAGLGISLTCLCGFEDPR